MPSDPRPRSLAARTLLPVLGGAVLLAVTFGVLWLLAVVLSGDADDLDVQLGDDVFEVGRVDRLADQISDDGPLLLPGLVGPAGRRPVGLDHEGGDDADGWRVFSLVPDQRDASCLVELEQGTGLLVDCEGVAHAPAALPEAPDVEIVIEPDSGELSLDLRAGG